MRLSNEEHMMQEFLMILGGGCLGGFLGYVISVERNRTQRRVQQELWDRKFHMCDTDREQAVTALNQNQVATESMRAQHSGLVSRSKELENIANRASTIQSSLEAGITDREERISQLTRAVTNLKKENT